MAKEQKRKLENNWKESKDQENEINNLDKINLENAPANIIKKNAEIVLADRTLVTQSTSFSLSYTFDNLPEWAIPHFRIKYFFSSENGYPMSLTVFSSNIRDIWVQNGEGSNNYIFSLIITASLFYESNRIPLYITASLIFDNPRIFNELQFNKT